MRLGQLNYLLRVSFFSAYNPSLFEVCGPASTQLDRNLEISSLFTFQKFRIARQSKEKQ